MDVQIWDWLSEEWLDIQLDVGINADPTFLQDQLDRYLGPLNRVRIRLFREEGGGFLNLNMIGVEFEGSYASEQRASRTDAAQG